MVGERGRILTRPLTSAECALCEKHHDVIEDLMKRYYIRDPGLDMYGECALALMDAAQKYLTNDKLRKFSFRQIAYQHIRNRIQSLIAISEKHPKLSLDSICKDGETTYGELIVAHTSSPKACKSVLMLYRQCIDNITPKEYEALSMYGNGMTHSEISSMLGIHKNTVYSRIEKARKRCTHLIDAKQY